MPTTKRRVSAGETEENKGKRHCMVVAEPSPAVAVAAPSHTPEAHPPVWAKDRQSLCETLPTFRAYQGALYHTSGLVKGMLLAEDMGPSYLDDEVAIFRGPGKAGTREDGTKCQLSSHSWQDAAIKALVNTKDTASIIFLHVSSSNNLLGAELPHPICTLGAFWITDVWAARLDGQVSVWCKAQKLDLTRSSWWMSHVITRPERLDPTTEIEASTCDTCSCQSFRKYKQSWLCLNDQCDNFFRDSSGASLQGALEYSNAFLSQRLQYPGDLASVPQLLPDLLNTDSATDQFWWMRDEATRGVVCSGCGQCLPRKLFRGWQCDSCSFKFFPEMAPITIESLLGPCAGTSYQEPVTSLPAAVTNIGEWRITTFTLDEENTITMFQANKAINTALGGSDDLFVALQQDPRLELRRFALHNRAQKEFLAAHYSQNFGMPYKYVVATDSKPFSEAPDPVLAVKARLTWATQQVVGDDHDNYNELLAVGYFAGNKMGFHDDGEKDLGPNVTSLSLGSNSTMSFRVKRKYHAGYTGASFQRRNLIKTMDPIMPGAFLAEERRALLNQNLTMAEYQVALKDLYEGYWHKMVAQHGSKKATSMTQRATMPKNLVKLQLRHGDMVLMSGHRIQKYLEHEADGIAGLRYALTCREINLPDNPDNQAMTHIPADRRSRFDGLVHHQFNAKQGC